jgi:hypothetical protein
LQFLTVLIKYFKIRTEIIENSCKDTITICYNKFFAMLSAIIIYKRNFFIRGLSENDNIIELEVPRSNFQKKLIRR